MRKWYAGIGILVLIFALCACSQSHEHQWKDADCVHPQLCTDCGAAEGESLGHSWQDADCTAPRTCSVCGAVDGAPLGHDWLDADCTSPKTCARCAEVRGEAAHNWAPAGCVDPKTCMNCGITEGEPLGHLWLEATCVDPQTCDRCGRTTGEALGHSWLDVTCEAPKTCERCALTEGEALGHDWVEASCEVPQTCARCAAVVGEALEHDWQAPDCTHALVCGICGKTVGTPLGHSWQAPTCTEPSTCSVCGETTGIALGHSWQEATCTEGRVCRTCGESGGDALGHTWIEATCILPRICARCGEQTEAALGHDWQEATCTQPQTCARCSLTQGEPAGHVWTSADGTLSCSVCGQMRLSLTAGSYVTFGSYEQDNVTANGTEPIEWLVLEVDGSRVLLLSRYGLDAQPYHPENIDMTWADSFVRSWLNTEFLQQAFSPEEIDAILLTQVDNSAAQGYSGFTTGGGVNTQDQIFFLSYTEANRYLGVLYKTESGARDNMEGRLAPTAYAIAKGANSTDSSQTAFGERTGWWWLRSPAKTQDQAAYVGIFGAFDNSELDDAHGSVRPALWIDLDKACDLVKTPVDPYRPASVTGAGSGSNAAGSASGAPDATLENMICKRIGHLWNSETPRVCIVCGTVEEVESASDAPASSGTSLEDMVCKRIGHLWNSETPRVCMVCGTVEETESASGAPAASGTSSSTVTAGSYLTFGSYEQDNVTANGAEPIEWLVLEVSDGKALVVSRYALDARRYDEHFRELTWEDCTLRSWLNHDFLDAAFTAQEQSAILTTEVDNSSSQCFDFVAACGWAQPVRGGSNTRDKVFLLSFGEVSRYMNVTYTNSANMDARCAPTDYAIAQGAALSSGDKTREGRTSGDWWLRSPGTDQHYGAYVLGSGQLTHLNYVVQTYFAGVRPALWIDLEAAGDLVMTSEGSSRPDSAAGSEAGAAGSASVDAGSAAAETSGTSLEDMVCKRIGHLWNSDTPRVCMVCGTVEGAEIVSDAPAASETSASTVTVGSYLTFGSYEQDNDTANGAEPVEWLVLEVSDGKAMVISRYGLDVKPYHIAQSDITWEKSHIRSWLNSSFMDTVFTPEEQAAILTTNVDNGVSQHYFMTNGGSDTQDKLFFLSYAEADRYFGVTYIPYASTQVMNSEACAVPTAFAAAHGALTKPEYVLADGSHTGMWWLRSPGGEQDRALLVYCDGGITYGGDVDNGKACVRPAFWIDLNAAFGE